MHRWSYMHKWYFTTSIQNSTMQYLTKGKWLLPAMIDSLATWPVYNYHTTGSVGWSAYRDYQEYNHLAKTKEQLYQRSSSQITYNRWTASDGFHLPFILMTQKLRQEIETTRTNQNHMNKMDIIRMLLSNTTGQFLGTIVMYWFIYKS